MNSSFTPLPMNSKVGEYRLLGVKAQGADHIDYNAENMVTARNAVLREYVSAGIAYRDEQSGRILPVEGQEEAFALGLNTFLSAANPNGLLGQIEDQGNTYLAYGSNKPAITQSPAPLVNRYQPRKLKSSGGGFGIVIFIIVLLLAGGGGYLVWQNYKEEQALIAQREAEARRLAEEKAAREREEAERRRLAEEKARAEAEERARLAAEEEARRRAEEERLRRLAEEANRKGAIVVKPQPPKEDDKFKKAADDDPRFKLYEQPLALTGASATSTKNLTLWHEAMNTAFETHRYDIYRNFIEKNLKDSASKLTSFGKFDTKTFFESPYFKRAMKTFNLLSIVTPELILDAQKENKNAEKFYKTLIEDKDEITTTLLRSLTGKETQGDISRIMDSWLTYWEREEGENRKKYMNLGLACALVNPAMQGGCRMKNESPIPMEEVYAFFRDKAEKGLLKTDITKMSPSDLIYVVDVRLPLSEMEWAVKNMKSLSRSSWSKAYPMIKYRMDQAKSRKDIYTYYSFAELLEKGGTCMDQGYFATNTAKSNGIPASYMTGDGKLGPHAWFVYKKDGLNWETAGGYGYTSGKTNSPQTNLSVHESMFLTAGDKKNSGDRLDKTMDYIDLYRTMLKLGLNDAVLDLLTKAQLSTPEHTLPWETTIEYYSREGNKTTLEQWELLVDTLRRRFKKRPDYLELATSIEDEHIFPHKSAQDVKNTLARQRRELEKNTEGRADLSAEAVQRQAELLVSQEKYNELSVLYRKAMKDYGTRLDTFREVVQQYYDYSANAPDKEKRLPGVVKEIDRYFQKYAHTGSDNLFVAKMEVGMQNKIAGYYRAIGNDKKADNMVKQGEARMAKINKTIK